jgi:spermidine synthase
MAAVPTARVRPLHVVAIFGVSLAGLLLEIGYTRIVSFKLWYYYTYLVIGLALLGLGSGGVLVVLSRRARATATDTILSACSIGGAVVIAVGYFVVARLPINTLQLWDYGSGSSFLNFFALALICFVLFVSFLPIGVILATILGRAPSEVGRIYFADLIGAGLGCVLAIPFISRIGPPRVIMLCGLVLAAVGVAALPVRKPSLVTAGAVITAALLVATAFGGILPDIRPEAFKVDPKGAEYSAWGPIFRVDVLPLGPNAKMLSHDGAWGSGLWRYNGDPASLARYETEPRGLPFQTLGRQAQNVVIIGSAGGNEILTSLHYHAKRIDGVELNPVTLSLLRKHFADFTGHLPDQPGVHLHQADGRTYLARSKSKYDMIWFVAPDSYAATNAASSGAFVLSESYLYTKQMIVQALKHLGPDGIVVTQFGELNVATHPDRTLRYLATVRAAFKEVGITDPAAHITVAEYHGAGDLSTIMLKRTPFTAGEAARYAAAIPRMPNVTLVAAPGHAGSGMVHTVATGSDAAAHAVVSKYSRSVTAVSDDAPFFWHFASFKSVLSDIFRPMSATNPEFSIGERVLVLLLAVVAVFAAVFLLLPFFAVRRQWRQLPAKGTSAVYFAALGLGFMFFEISLIQRLVLFLGYPTYSLTVTLASLLVFAGLGALLSRQVRGLRFTMPVLVVVVLALALFYRFGLSSLTSTLLDSPFGVRVVVTTLLLAPLGLCLGMFMPLGLEAVAALTPQADAYVAWSWAVNGFFSVIGSVLTTILAMSLGFRTVQLLAVFVYAIAGLAFWRLRVLGRETSPASEALDDVGEVRPAVATAG